MKDNPEQTGATRFWRRGRPRRTGDTQKIRPRSLRRIVANLLILAGLGLLLYPAGTWGYTWWEQRVLEGRLEQEHPVLAGDTSHLFTEDTTLAEPASEDAGQGAEDEAARRLAAEKLAFREAAQAFTAENKDKNGPIGKILIPRIGVDSILIHGTGRNDLREGPGHWPETPMPGMEGNFVVSGHRTTYGGPFFRLDKLEPGDQIDVLLPYVAARYEVSRSIIVKPDEVEVVAQRGVEEISLATCHPIYSARQRLVVQAELVSFRLLGAAADAAAPKAAAASPSAP